MSGVQLKYRMGVKDLIQMSGLNVAVGQLTVVNSVRWCVGKC